MMFYRYIIFANSHLKFELTLKVLYISLKRRKKGEGSHFVILCISKRENWFSAPLCSAKCLGVSDNINC